MHESHSVRKQQINQNHLLQHNTGYNIYYSYPLENLIFPRNKDTRIIYKYYVKHYPINI